MDTHQLQLLIFVVVQSAFVFLDSFELWRLNDKPRLTGFLGAHRRLAGFLAVVWAVYFTLQNLLLAAMPSPETTLAWFAAEFDFSPPPMRPGFQSAAFIALFLIFTYFAVSLFDYAIHRWLLHHRRFWFLHESHHLPRLVFNGMPGISLRPFAAVSIFLTYLAASAAMMAAIKLTRLEWLFGWYVNHLPLLILLFTIVGSASHSCFLRRYWLAHRIMRRLFLVTPQEHILHHAAGGNCNYGNFASFWDRVFGTYVDPLRLGDDPLKLGLDYDQDFLGALCGGKWKLSDAVRNNYQLNLVCNLSCGTKEVQR